MRPAAMLTSASRPGAPVPSITWPPRISRSSMAFRHPPDLLGRPFARPLQRDVRVFGRGGLPRSHLDQVLDLQTPGSETPDPVARRQVGLHARGIPPLDP